MSRLCLILFLGSVLISSTNGGKAHVDKDTEIINVSPSHASNALLEPPQQQLDIHKCEFKSNKNEKCVFFHKEEDEFEEEKKKCPKRFDYGRGGFFGGCTLRLDSKADIAGAWEITSYYKEGETNKTEMKKFALFLNTEVNVLPDVGSIAVYSGHKVYIMLEGDYPKDISCNLRIGPDGKEFDLVHGNNEGSFRRYGQCGFQMQVDDSTPSTTYRLEAGNGYFTYSRGIDLHVFKTDQIQEMENRTVIRGREVTVSIGSSTCASCEFVDPQGETYPLKKGDCSLRIVYELNHAGIWNAKCNFPGKLEPFVYKYNLTVTDWDVGFKVDTRKTGDQRGRINLQCIPNFETKVCQFVRPDNKVLNVHKGIGDDKYTHTGNVIDADPWVREQSGDCSLTILKPTDVDIGMWTCRVLNGHMVLGAFLRVTNQDVRSSSKIADFVPITGNDVFTKVDDSFEISCKTRNTIKYCWFSSSNGTIFQVGKKNKDDPFTLEYKGSETYSLGDCTAKVPKASFNDSGVWRCNLGLTDGSEISKDIRVTVAKDYLYANSDVLQVQSSGSMDIVTSVIPGYDSTVTYCRWIRPDGQGLGTREQKNYSMKQNSTHCSLTIKSASSEDIGEWVSVAQVTGDGKGEKLLRITVVDTSAESSYASLGLGLGLFVLTIVVIIAAMILIKKRLFIAKKLPQYCDKIYPK